MNEQHKPRVAFLGLGIMGSGMARRILLGGFPLTVFNRSSDKAKQLAMEGAQVAASPGEAASQADVIISMVADDNASRSLWLGANGALSQAAPHTTCIECSTVTVGWVRELAAAAHKKNCDLLDAPVTGSKTHAASGDLSFLVGGENTTLEKVRPVLAAMGKAIVPLGPLGSGALLKLINNFVCGVQVASFAEAMVMIERGGLDSARALEVIVNGAPGSPLVKTVSARIAAADFTPNFLLKLMAKDLAYAIQEADKMSLDLVTAKAAKGKFQSAAAVGYGDKDIAAIVEPLRQK